MGSVTAGLVNAVLSTAGFVEGESDGEGCAGSVGSLS